MSNRNVSTYNHSKGVSEFIKRQSLLPHWQCPQSLYFITFKTYQRRILSPQSKTIVMDALKFWDKNRLDLFYAVVMDDHVHALLKPLEKSTNIFWDISTLMHSIKGFSAKSINKIENTLGKKVWQSETFDRIVRDHVEYSNTISYIVHNPVKAKYVENPEDYPWLLYKRD